MWRKEKMKFNLKKCVIYALMVLMTIAAAYSFFTGHSEAHLLFFILLGIILYWCTRFNERLSLAEEDITHINYELGRIEEDIRLIQKIQEGNYEEVDFSKDNIDVSTKIEKVDTIE